jgi:adenylate cyclase
MPLPNTDLFLCVYRDRQPVFAANFDGTVEVGRQVNDEETLFHVYREPPDAPYRIPLIDKEDTRVSRRQLLCEPLGSGKIRLTNLSGSLSVRLVNGSVLSVGGTRELYFPVELMLGPLAIRLDTPWEESLLGLLTETPPMPGSLASPPARPVALASLRSVDLARDVLAWVTAALNVFQSAAGSTDFFRHAAQALVDLAELDSGRVLLVDARGEWVEQAACTAESFSPTLLSNPSRRVLDGIRKEGRTIWELPVQAMRHASVAGIKAVVAAPILDKEGRVIGALYGDRYLEGRYTTRGPLTELEARLVDLLATGVAVGLARVEQERTAAAERVRFEQFFTPELARQLTRRPDMLFGRDQEVTVLFCDIRGFSRISERLGPAVTSEWFSEVLEALSGRVLGNRGVLIDYVGDELMAMWGAPEEQPEHARLACRAALDMLSDLVELNARWQERVGEPVRLGIGINTGLARVGNSGSKYKFKYGPRGNTVNLASRVQGTTKHFKCAALIAASTRRQLDDSFRARRLGAVRVVNIEEPVEVHELVPERKPGWPDSKTQYEEALGLFEEKEFAQAARLLGNWRAQQSDDEPALVLLHRAVRCMVEGPSPAHPVWVLTEK